MTILLAEVPELSYYEMDKRPCGICLMINNTPNLGNEEKELANLFASLAFDVKVRRGLEMFQIYEVAQEFARKDHSRYNSFVFIVMSVCGQDHEITGVDRRKASVEQVMSEFKTTNCPPLQNKPKLFFVVRYTVAPSKFGESHDSSLEAHCCCDKAVSLFSSCATTGGDACPEEADFLLTCVTIPVVETKQVTESVFIQVGRKLFNITFIDLSIVDNLKRQ